MISPLIFPFLSIGLLWPTLYRVDGYLDLTGYYVLTRELMVEKQCLAS